MYLKTRFIQYISLIFLVWPFLALGQQVTNGVDSLVVKNQQAMVVLNYKTGCISYRFNNGVTLNNTIAYLNEVDAGYLATADCKSHQPTTAYFKDTIGSGVRLIVKHSGNEKGIILIQQILVYRDHPYLLVNLTATSSGDDGKLLETRDICPLALSPKQHGALFQPGAEPRVLDVPFDNDNWLDILERKWEGSTKLFSGTSYEFLAVYDNANLSGMVVGSLTHDFWKTGVVYRSAKQTGVIDFLKIFGGVSTADNPSLKPAFGGLNGTHDHAPHGTMLGRNVSSPLIYLCGLTDVRKAFIEYGKANVAINGRLAWKGYAPVYWNSFGVEGVLGHKGIMMPKDILKITDFIHSMNNFSQYSK